jgi:hypothetical protein
LTLAICDSRRRFKASNRLRTMDENVLYMMHLGGQRQSLHLEA